MTYDEKYKRKFENDVSWKQSNRGFIIQLAGHYPEDTHNKNNDLAPLFINRIITKVSKINAKGYKNEPLCSRLVSSLLPIGNFVPSAGHKQGDLGQDDTGHHQDEKGEWQNLENFHYMELKIALDRGFVIDYVGETFGLTKHQ